MAKANANVATGAESVVVKGVGGKKKKISLEAKKARHGWLFVLPFVIGFIAIYCPIIFDSITYSFSNINNLNGGGYELEFVWFDN